MIDDLDDPFDGWTPPPAEAIVPPKPRLEDIHVVTEDELLPTVTTRGRRHLDAIRAGIRRHRRRAPWTTWLRKLIGV